MRAFLRVYFSFEDDAQALSDEEKGRLLLSMLRYAKDGTVSDMTGNERFLFPVFRSQIDRDIEVYEVKVSNGLNGGRPKGNPEKTDNNQRKPKTTKANRRKPEKTENNQNAQDNEDSEGNEGSEDSEGRTRRRLTPPTLAQVTEYCRERGKGVDPNRWYNYYSSNGWKVGRNPMKDWKAAVRTWENNGYSSPAKQVVAQQYSQRDYSEDDDLESFDRVLKILQGDMMA